MILVENCQESAAKGEFVYMHQDQKTYLKSIIAYYLGNVFSDSTGEVAGAISIDSDCPNLFQQAECDKLRRVIAEFGQRIRFHLALMALLTKKEES